MTLRTLIIISFTLLIFSGCKKSNVNQPISDAELSKQILNDFALHVSQATYYDLQTKSAQLFISVQEFNSNPTDANLSECKQLWKDTRAAWELSEGFLFGPVSTENIDPRIDTWPVNHVDLDSVLSTTSALDATYINLLEDALRGFHPVEYLLFGISGQKTAAQFTPREKEYLIALSENLKTLTSQLADYWNPALANNYYNQFINAGESGNIYSTKRAAFIELVNAMAGICDEVANGKMAEPFLQQNPALEESPFSSNSIIDFTNNIRSAQNVYLGKYNSDGKGIEDLVRNYNLSLDANVKQKFTTAIASIQNITIPFGQAILQQPTQVQLAMDAINELQTVLDGDLKSFLQQHTN